MIRRDRNFKGGGVLIAISNELDGYEVEIQCQTESIYACLHSTNKPATLIGRIYRPPDRKKKYRSTVLAELKQVIATPKPSHIVVGGDFNLPGVNWKHKRVPLGTQNKKQAKCLLSFMEELHLHQMVHIPTRNSNILDLLFTDAPDLINKVSSAPGLSDHDTVIVDHQLKAFINKKEPRSVPLYHKANWEEVKQCPRVFATSYFPANKDIVQPINTNWSDIKHCITTCIADLIPHKSIGTRFHLPYITKPIQIKNRKRQRVYRKVKKSDWQKDWDQCHTLKRDIMKELNAAFNDYVNNMLNVGDDAPGAMKRFFRFIKSLHQDSFGVSALKANGKVAATPTEKANMCNAQFQSVFNPCSNPDTTPRCSDPPLPRMPDIIITTPALWNSCRNWTPAKRQALMISRPGMRCGASPSHSSAVSTVPRWRRSTGGLEISECPPHLQEGLQVWPSQLPSGGPDSNTMQAAGALHILMPPLAPGQAQLDQALPTWLLTNAIMCDPATYSNHRVLQSPWKWNQNRCLNSRL